MSKRAAAVAQTRQRIVEATLELHGERGIASTSWDDIAARAGVGVGTVYRHFPSLDELIPACGDVAMQAMALPSPETVPAIFADASGPQERIERLVREVFAIYERGGKVLGTIRREASVHPRVEQDRGRFQSLLGALVDAALAPLNASGEDRSVVRAMVDLDAHEAFRAQGIGRDESIAAISAMLAGRFTAEDEGRSARCKRDDF